jgi:hypothetical protein
MDDDRQETGSSTDLSTVRPFIRYRGSEGGPLPRDRSILKSTEGRRDRDRLRIRTVRMNWMEVSESGRMANQGSKQRRDAVGTVQRSKEGARGKGYRPEHGEN